MDEQRDRVISQHRRKARQCATRTSEVRDESGCPQCLRFSRSCWSAIIQQGGRNKVYWTLFINKATATDYDQPFRASNKCWAVGACITNASGKVYEIWSAPYLLYHCLSWSLHPYTPYRKLLYNTTLLQIWFHFIDIYCLMFMAVELSS